MYPNHVTTTTPVGKQIQIPVSEEVPSSDELFIHQLSMEEQRDL